MFLEIIKDIKEFFENHKQVNKFGFGESSNISTKENLFPMVWLQPTNSPISEFEIDYKFDLFCFTLAEQDKENLKNSLNDTQQILLDFIAYFKINQNEDYWLSTANINFTPFNAKFDDYTNGWQLTFNFISDFDYNSCTIPLNNLAMSVEQLTTNTEYTYYDIEVTASGGLAPYSGTGVFDKTYGTYTFNVTDADGDSVSEEFTVLAPIPEPYYQWMAAVNELDDNIYLEPVGFYLYAGTYYVNWGDGTDAIVVMATTTWIEIYNKHIYDSTGFKNIGLKQLDPTTLELIQFDTFRPISNAIIDLRLFNDFDVREIIINYSQSVYGDVSVFKLDSTSTKKLGMGLSTAYLGYLVGDISNFKYYETVTIRQAVDGLYGDLAELCNQDRLAIYVNFQDIKPDVSAIDPTYTDDKSIKYMRTYSATFDDEQTTNILMQTSQNQVYVGGTLLIYGSNIGKIDLTDPVVLAAYNHLISLGWSVTIPTY